jgi:hypothetical protein
MQSTPSPCSPRSKNFHSDDLGRQGKQKKDWHPNQRDQDNRPTLADTAHMAINKAQDQLFGFLSPVATRLRAPRSGVEQAIPKSPITPHSLQAIIKNPHIMGSLKNLLEQPSAAGADLHSADHALGMRLRQQTESTARQSQEAGYKYALECLFYDRTLRSLAVACLKGAVLRSGQPTIGEFNLGKAGDYANIPKDSLQDLATFMRRGGLTQQNRTQASTPQHLGVGQETPVTRQDLKTYAFTLAGDLNGKNALFTILTPVGPNGQRCDNPITLCGISGDQQRTDVKLTAKQPEPITLTLLQNSLNTAQPDRPSDFASDALESLQQIMDSTEVTGIYLPDVDALSEQAKTGHAGSPPHVPRLQDFKQMPEAAGFEAGNPRLCDTEHVLARFFATLQTLDPERQLSIHQQDQQFDLTLYSSLPMCMSCRMGLTHAMTMGQLPRLQRFTFLSGRP